MSVINQFDSYLKDAVKSGASREQIEQYREKIFNDIASTNLKDKSPELISALKQQFLSDTNIILSKHTPDKGVLGHAKDAGLSVLKGAIAVPEAAVGLADIPTGGRVGKFLENKEGMIGFRPAEARQALDELHTDRYKQQQQDFSNAEGVAAKVSEAFTNPTLITNTAIESLPMMGAGGVVGRGAALALPSMSRVAAGAVGEGTVMAGSQAEAIRNESKDRLLTPEQSGAAVATGALGAAFSYGGGQIAKRLGVGDVDTMLTTRGLTGQSGQSAKVAAKSIPRQVIQGAISEGLLEELPQSASEQIIQNLALDKPWHEGVEDAAVLGALTGGLMGGSFAGYAGIHHKTDQPNQNTPSTEIFPTDIGRVSDGKPFANKNAAALYQNKNSLKDTHDIVQVGKGRHFVLREKVDNTQSEQVSAISEQQPEVSGLEQELIPEEMPSFVPIESLVQNNQPIESESTPSKTGLAGVVERAQQRIAINMDNVPAEQVQSEQDIAGLEGEIDQPDLLYKDPITTPTLENTVDESSVITEQEPDAVNLETDPKEQVKQQFINDFANAHAGQIPNAKTPLINQAIEQDIPRHEVLGWVQEAVSQVEQQPDAAEVEAQPETIESGIKRPVYKDDPLLEAWSTLAQDDDIYTLPTSTNNNMQDIAKEVLAPDFQINENYDVATVRKTDKAWLIKLPNQQNAYVMQKGNNVWLDVADSEIGSEGKQLYNLVANYAFNNNLKFTGDPDGLSDVAMSRRLENMLSSAFKFGTTRHLEPHPLQLKGNDDVPALDWKEGDDAHNLKQMILASYEATKNQFPEIENLTYNPDKNRFEDKDSGREFSERDFDELAIRARSHGSGDRFSGVQPLSGTSQSTSTHKAGNTTQVTGGRETLRRNALTHALLRKSGSERTWLLDALGSGVSKPVRFYSQRAREVEARTGSTTEQVRKQLIERFANDTIIKLETMGKLEVINELGSIPNDALNSIMAFHGSPYKFDKFSLDHLGRGDGHQLYGHGLYFSDSRAVSEFYRKNLAKNDDGQLYQVDIDSDSKDILNWEDSLTSQKEVLDRLKPLQEHLKQLGVLEQYETMLGFPFDEWNGGELYTVLKHAAKNDVLPQPTIDLIEAVEMGRSDKAASLYLHHLGINGLKYAQSARDGVIPTGSSNYVIFDDSAIQITDMFFSQNPNGIEGYYHNGKVTLVAANLTPETVVPTFLHEMGGHAGMQGLIKPSTYDAIMQQFDQMVKAGNPLALEAKKRAEVETDPEVQKQEYLPYLITVATEAQQVGNGKGAAYQAVQRFIQRMVNAIKAWAVDKLGVPLKLNPDDVVALAERMVRHAAKTKGMEWVKELR